MPDTRLYLVEGIELVHGLRCTASRLGVAFAVGEAAAKVIAAELRAAGWIAVRYVLWDELLTERNESCTTETDVKRRTATRS